MKSLLTVAIICSLTSLAFAQNFGIDISSPTEKLHVNGNSLVSGNSYTVGNVGVGTIVPAFKLDVAGDFNFTGLLRISGSSGTSGNLLRSNGASAPTWTTVATLMLDLTAGTGITSSVYDGSVARTFNVVARNGITDNADDIELGGTLDETTTIAQDAFDMNYDLTGTGDFIVKVVGVNAMWVQEDGNTYIGATNAGANNLFIANDIIDWDNVAYDLDPNSVSHLNEIEADLGSVTDPSYTFDGDANNGMFSPGADITAFTTAGVERVRINATGNVGIGTTAPAFKLDIVGTTSNVNIESSSGQAYLVIDKPTAAGSAYVNFKVAGADGWVTGPYAGSAFRLIDWPNGGSANAALYIQQGGTNNVGIGTITPANLLDISTADATSGIALDARVALTGYDGDGWLRLNQSSEWTSGVYTPSHLRVDGEIRQGSADAGGYEIQTGAQIYAGDYIIALGGVHVGGTADPGTDNLIVDGDVGIGTAAPGYPLEVATTNAPVQTFATGKYGTTANATTWTNAATTNLVTPAISIKANGYVWSTTGILASSDARAKENIESKNSETSLDLINQLNVVQYNWIDKTKSNHQFEDGFIAQELEKVMPEAVDKNREFIPNIYALAERYKINGDLLEITLAKEADVKKGDLIKLYTEEGKELRLSVSGVKGNVYYMPVDEESKNITGQLFVYGREVDDFSTVNYDRVFTVGISAMQELSKQLDVLKAENASLKSENGNIKTNNEELTNRMNGLKAEIDLINERLGIKAGK